MVKGLKKTPAKAANYMKQEEGDNNNLNTSTHNMSNNQQGNL